jgi:MFS family permease
MAVFRERNYRLFWFGGAISNSGRWMQAIALPFILHELTDSGTWVGLGGFASIIPMALMGPLAGSLADRYPRRTLLLYTQTGNAIGAAILTIVWVTGVRSPGVYVALAAMTGVVAGLNLPAWQAFVSELVPRPMLLDAVTLNSAQFNAARAVGPALAGIVLATLGPAWAFGINAVSYSAVLIALALISVPGRVMAARPISVRSEYRTALRYANRRPSIVTSYVAIGAIGLLGMPIVSLAVLFARDVFEVGEGAFGLMVSMVGIGAVVFAPVVTGFGHRISRSRLEFVSMLAYGVALLAVALAPVFWMALVGMGLVGAAHLVTASTLNTTIQLHVDDDMRGKVLAIYLTSLLVANPIGQLVLGGLSDGIGPRAAVAGAAGLLLAATAWLQLSGRLATLDDDPVLDTEPAPDVGGVDGGLAPSPAAGN